jgi:hypothetical protein
VVETRRGWHIYFEQPDRYPIGCPKQHALGENIDVKGHGGMVLGPGSVIDGHDYALVRGDLARVGRCPYWLSHLLVPRKRTLSEQRRLEHQRSKPLRGWAARMKIKQAVMQISNAPPGHRNDRLNTWAYALRNVELDDVDVFNELMCAASDAGLPYHEARATIQSGLGRRE